MKNLFKMLLVCAVMFISGCSKDDSVSSDNSNGVTPQVTIFSKSGLLDSIYCTDVYSYKINNLASFNVDSSKKYIINFRISTNATNSVFSVAKNVYGINTDTTLYYKNFQNTNRYVSDTVKPNFDIGISEMKYVIAVNALYKYISIRDLKIIKVYQ